MCPPCHRRSATAGAVHLTARRHLLGCCRLCRHLDGHLCCRLWLFAWAVQSAHGSNTRPARTTCTLLHSTCHRPSCHRSSLLLSPWTLSTSENIGCAKRGATLGCRLSQ